MFGPINKHELKFAILPKLIVNFTKYVYTSVTIVL